MNFHTANIYQTLLSYILQQNYRSFLSVYAVCCTLYYCRAISLFKRCKPSQGHLQLSLLCPHQWLGKPNQPHLTLEEQPHSLGASSMFEADEMWWTQNPTFTVSNNVSKLSTHVKRTHNCCYYVYSDNEGLMNWSGSDMLENQSTYPTKCAQVAINLHAIITPITFTHAQDSNRVCDVRRVL